MSAPELSYSVRQVTAAMGLTGAMVRKYARAYEDLTHEHIRMVGRDGRQFNQKQFDAMLEAKRLVETHPGLTVDAAMRAAVGLSEVVDRLVPAQSQELNIEGLKTAFSESLEASVTIPLIAKLAELQAEVVALRKEVAEVRALPVEANGGVMNGIEPQRQEQESWLTEVTGREFVAASERPVEIEGSVGSVRSPDEVLGAAEDASDGPMVRAARWLERRLRGRGSSS